MVVMTRVPKCSWKMQCHCRTSHMKYFSEYFWVFFSFFWGTLWLLFCHCKVASLLFKSPAWPYGVIKCLLDVCFRILSELVGDLETYCSMSAVNSDILLFSRNVFDLVKWGVSDISLSVEHNCITEQCPMLKNAWNLQIYPGIKLFLLTTFFKPYP